jgi:hypothetical protein
MEAFIDVATYCQHSTLEAYEVIILGARNNAMSHWRHHTSTQKSVLLRAGTLRMQYLNSFGNTTAD